MANYATTHEAAKNGDLADVERHLQLGADVNAKDKYDWSPLMYAANKGHFDVVKYLVDKGANVNAKDKDGKTPLTCAVEHGDLDVVKYLIAKGANVNARSKDGATPLGLAVLADKRSVVKFLKQHGAEECQPAQEPQVETLMNKTDVYVPDHDGSPSGFGCACWLYFQIVGIVFLVMLGTSISNSGIEGSLRNPGIWVLLGIWIVPSVIGFYSINKLK